MNVDIKPLLGSIEPHLGESLMSIMLRTADVNVFPYPKDMLRLIGIKAPKPEFIAYSQIESTGAIAQLLDLNTREVLSRTHPVVTREGYSECVDWYGTPLPRKFLAANRRISPGWLRKRHFDRAIWSVRALKFCPASFENLIEHCPHCPEENELTWTVVHGTHLCSVCGRSLLRAKPGKIAWRLRKFAKLAADLVNPNPSVRAKAVACFPEPFCSWEAGDVFVAVIDMGLLETEVGSQQYARVSKLVSAGDFSEFTEKHLTAGIRSLLNWPHSVRALLGTEVMYRTGGFRKRLGRFGRFTGKQMAKRPIVELLQSEAQIALRKSDLSVGTAGILPEWLKRDDRISAKEAVARYGIDMKTLKRLDRKGLSVVRQSGREDRVCYNPALLAPSVDAYKAGISTEGCARKLGVPSYIAPELEELGLISVILDHDAILLAGGEARITKACLRGLLDTIEQKAETAGPGVPIAEAMAGVMDPRHWASTLEAIVSGAVRIVRKTRKNAPPMQHLVVHAGDLETLRRDWPPEILPTGVTLTCQEAAHLLGRSAKKIDNAIAAKYLRTFDPLGSFGRKSDLRVRLDDLARLRNTAICADRGARRDECAESPAVLPL